MHQEPPLRFPKNSNICKVKVSNLDIAQSCSTMTEHLRFSRSNSRCTISNVFLRSILATSSHNQTQDGTQQGLGVQKWHVYSVWVYIFPLFYIIYSYTFLVKAVAAHEKGMREQAKKMGVKSLRSEEAQKTSAECRLCKVALMTVTLWFMAWTPYFVINWGGMFNKPMVTPLFSIWGSVFAKANAVYNPIVYAISQPKYRAALDKKLPILFYLPIKRITDRKKCTMPRSIKKGELAPRCVI
ncbi:rhodopsin, long-wavelength-like [Penaeus vannamei]|uniref:rhodopsin, long-wavelength-like n=1 Tax=Penaeus vannamei TaxID=6689 RepID=UPI00387F8C8E